MALAESPPRFVRADGPDKVTGSGRYAADLTLTGMLWAKFRFAGIAHARITKLDVEPARSMPGVLAVLTADDVPDVRFSPVIPDRTLFARDVVRFEGEVIAAVAAVDAETAQRAADAIVVEFEPLPVVSDPEAALEADSPLVHADWESYDVTGDTPRNGNDACHSSISRGDAAAAMAEADIVVTSRFDADGPPRCRSMPALVCAKRWSCHRTGCASSCPTLVVGSAASAVFTSRLTSQPWPAQLAARSSWCSLGQRNSRPPTGAANR